MLRGKPQWKFKKIEVDSSELPYNIANAVTLGPWTLLSLHMSEEFFSCEDPWYELLPHGLISECTHSAELTSTVQQAVYTFALLVNDQLHRSY